MPTVSFATACWEKDWKTLLREEGYLETYQIGNHRFPFCEKILVINNVQDLQQVEEEAQKLVARGVLTRVVVATDDVAGAFSLKREEFVPDGVLCSDPDWVYYNARAPLAAILAAKGDYLLYLTGDAGLQSPCSWIAPSLRWMEKDPTIFVANPVWNGSYREARRESYRKTWNFYRAKKGFSDQMFLVRTKEVQQPIYGYIDPQSGHYPRGDVFEKRLFSYMKREQKERIIYRRGSYTHRSF